MMAAFAKSPVPNPYSALERYPLSPLREALDVAKSRPSRLPWWANPLSWLALACIWLYQHAWPQRWKRECIYTPTCSRYTRAAIRRYGFLKGMAMGYKRIERCNGALYSGGEDFP